MVTELEPGDPGMEEMVASDPSGRSVMRLEGGAYQQQHQQQHQHQHQQQHQQQHQPMMHSNRGQRMRRMVALYDYDPHELSPNVDADDMELAFW